MRDFDLYTHLQSALATQSAKQLAACINLMEGQSSEFYAAVDYSAIKASLEQYLSELKKDDITPEKIAFIQQYLQTLNTILQNGGKSTIIPSFLSVLESFKDTLFTSENMDQFRICLTQTKKEQSPNQPAQIIEKPKDFEPNLFVACREGKLDSVQYLCEVAKVNTEATDKDGWTALHCACSWNRLTVVQYLCEVAKVNTEATDNGGRTPLHWACQRGHLPVVQYLCEVAKVSTEATDKFGRTPLHIACFWNRLPIVQYLCEVAKVNTEAKMEKERTPLHIACINNYLPVVQYLCEVAKVNTKGAYEKAKPQVKEYLKKYL